jgi:hypothetical protein
MELTSEAADVRSKESIEWMRRNGQWTAFEERKDSMVLLLLNLHLPGLAVA